jgi:aryl-alcohol dehydrogenase-like predicted oxidoreductase
VSAQDEHSLLVRDIERELIPALEVKGLGLLPYFPLASGLLTGKYARGSDVPQGTRMARMQRLADRFMTEKNWEIVGKLEAFCASHGRSMVELAFSWLLAKPVVSSVIAGATKPEQIDANVKATGWKLSSDDLAEIDRLTK